MEASAHRASGGAKLLVRPIGDEPEALLALRPGLDIWDAYATIHLLMPDGTMRLGGEAVAEAKRGAVLPLQDCVGRGGLAKHPKSEALAS